MSLQFLGLVCVSWYPTNANVLMCSSVRVVSNQRVRSPQEAKRKWFIPFVGAVLFWYVLIGCQLTGHWNCESCDRSRLLQSRYVPLIVSSDSSAAKPLHPGVGGLSRCLSATRGNPRSYERDAPGRASALPRQGTKLAQSCVRSCQVSFGRLWWLWTIETIETVDYWVAISIVVAYFSTSSFCYSILTYSDRLLSEVPSNKLSTSMTAAGSLAGLAESPTMAKNNK